jgi:hypothetical protein
VEQVFRRRQVKDHSRLAREELTESFGHLRMAAAHAADGAAGALAPRVEVARSVVKPGLSKARGAASDGMESLLSAALDGSREAKRMASKGKAKVTKKSKKQTGRRWPMMVGGLLAIGAAIGGASALMKRRREQRPWDEYSSTRQTSDTHSVLDSAKSAMDAGVDNVSSAADGAKDRTSDLIGR